jgi:hypothetical protein
MQFGSKDYVNPIKRDLEFIAREYQEGQDKCNRMGKTTNSKVRNDTETMPSSGEGVRP